MKNFVLPPRPKPKLVKKIAAETQEARERIAEAILDKKEVYKQIQEAASNGFYQTRITQKNHPISLRYTHYGQGLETRLNKDGFTVEWQPSATKILAPDTNEKLVETGRFHKYEEIVISWQC